MALLSPGVQVVEIDASTIAPTVSNSIAFFAGNFDKGPVGSYLLVSNENDLINLYGKPTIKNYNDWMQVSNFLKYGNLIYVARAANTNGSVKVIEGVTVTGIDSNDSKSVDVSSTENFSVGDIITFSDANGVVLEPFKILSVDTTNNVLTLDKDAPDVTNGDGSVYNFFQTINSVYEVTSDGSVISDYLPTQDVIGTYDEFENAETSIQMSSSATKVKFIARNPGAWGNNIEIAIANSSDFNSDLNAFSGIALDDLFEYYPTDNEVGIIVRLNDKIVETYTVSFDPEARNSSNKSMYIEDVINQQSSVIFCKDNTNNTNAIPSRLDNNIVKLVEGRDSDMGTDDLSLAYNLVSNKEEIDIDIVIANELDDGASAVALVNERKDCIVFIGANYEDCVGKKASVAVGNLVEWRQHGSINFNNMFVVACANYVYQYNMYLDKKVWVNIAGHIAGLRAQTNTNRASWYDKACHAA